jgi:hypothetical protein
MSNLPDIATNSSSPITLQKWAAGWKVANLVYDRGSLQAAFVPVHQRGLAHIYGADATATCTRPSHQHRAPAPGCDCGFCGFASNQTLSHVRYKGWRNDSLVRLRVALGGRIIRGPLSDGQTWGYRAARQVVADVYLQPACHDCGANLEQLPPLLTTTDPASGFYEYLVAVCPDHVRETSVTAAKLNQALPRIPFHWDPLPLPQPGDRPAALTAG